MRVNPYEFVENARVNSVNRDEEMARQREIRVERKKRAARFHRIEGAVLATVVLVSAYFTGPRVVDAFADYKNPSVEAGYQAVAREVHRTDDNQHFWFDYGDIAEAFDEGMDFDSYVYGTYQRIAGSGSGRTIINMNDLFIQFYNQGLTPYRSFEDYCFAHGFVKEDKGKISVDLDKYEKEARAYLKDLKAIEKKEEAVEEFRSK